MRGGYEYHKSVGCDKSSKSKLQNLRRKKACHSEKKVDCPVGKPVLIREVTYACNFNTNVRIWDHLGIMVVNFKARHAGL